jgi:glycosyltransferase involved in cell wall biosynthesis
MEQRALTATSAADGQGVSYVVPVYNKRPFLPAMIAGLAAQRGGFAREFVFIDDGSTDGSGDVLAELTATWPAVRILHQPNRGPSIATNRGIAAAQFPLIKLVDGDDVLLPDATRLLRDMLLQHPEAVAAYGRVERYQSTGEALTRIEHNASPSVATRLEHALPMLLRQTDLGPSNSLVRTSAARAVGGCDERVFTQDYSLLLRLAARGPFVATDAIVALAPTGDADRINDGGPQVLHDCNLTLMYFLSEHHLPGGLARPAIRRALTRASRWARRREGAGLLSRWRLMRLLGGLPVERLQLALLRHSSGAFTVSRRVRRGGEA